MERKIFLLMFISILFLQQVTAESCLFSEDETNNVFEQADYFNYGNCLNGEGITIEGRVNTNSDYVSDVDVFKIQGPFYAGDLFNVTLDYLGEWNTGDGKNGAVGIFYERQDESNLSSYETLLINDHRNIYLGNRGAKYSSILLRRDYDSLYVTVTVTPGYASSGNYNLVINRKRSDPAEFRGVQKILLDFDGEEDVRIGTRSPVSVPSMENSEFLSQNFPNNIQQIKEIIKDTIANDFKDYSVVVNSTDEVINDGTYSVIYFGTLDPALLGVAEDVDEGVDEYNSVFVQQAIVFVETFETFLVFNPSWQEVAQAIGNIGSHEAGHLLGLVHTAYPPELMDTTSSLSELMQDQKFSVAPIHRSVYPVGSENNGDLLDIILDVGCGNSVLDAGEECDDRSFPIGKSCVSYGFQTGNLHCSSTCQRDTSSCAVENSVMITSSTGRPPDLIFNTGKEACESIGLACNNIQFSCSNYVSGLDWGPSIASCTRDFSVNRPNNCVHRAVCISRFKDSDSSLDPPTQSDLSINKVGELLIGNVRDRNFRNDYCVNSNTVSEFFIKSSGASFNSLNVVCPSGQWCTNGKCESVASSCSDECRSYEKNCLGEFNKWVCGNANDGDSCLDKVYTSCPNGQICIYPRRDKSTSYPTCISSGFGGGTASSSIAIELGPCEQCVGEVFSIMIYDLFGNLLTENPIIATVGEDYYARASWDYTGLDITGFYYIATMQGDSSVVIESEVFNLPPVCGNGVSEEGEQCDDENTQSGDGCSYTCVLEYCGNNLLDSGEQCDDGNTINGDGCSATCRGECFDSDYGNYYKKGITGPDLNGVNYTDYCYSTQYNLMEYSCVDGLVTNSSFYCARGCLNGACRSPLGSSGTPVAPSATNPPTGSGAIQ